MSYVQIHVPNQTVNAAIVKAFQDNGWGLESAVSQLDGQYPYIMINEKSRTVGGNGTDNHVSKIITIEEALKLAALPVFKTHKVMLNRNHHATYTEGEQTVAVGCQVFDIDRIKALYDVIYPVKDAEPAGEKAGPSVPTTVSGWLQKIRNTTIRLRALRSAEKEKVMGNDARCMADAITAIHWAITLEGHDYWNEIHERSRREPI